MPAPLDLGYFILRAQALHLYRQALRSVRQAPPHARGVPPLRASRLAASLQAHVSVPTRLRTGGLTRTALLRRAAELRDAVRQATESGRGAQTREQMKFNLSEGKLQLKKLNDMLGLALPDEAPTQPDEHEHSHAHRPVDTGGHAGCGAKGHRH